MRVLADFTMQSRLRAIVAIGGLGALGVLFPPVAILAGGLVALVALRLGVGQAVLVAAFGTLMLSGIMLLLLRIPPEVGILSGLVQWLPVAALGEVLRRTISWRTTLALAALVVGLMVILARLFVSDLEAMWIRFGTEVLIPLTNGDPSPQMLQTLSTIAPFMTGLLAGMFMASLIFSLIVGRYWQALLYNPGAFGPEFQTLQLGPKLGIATVFLAVGGQFLATPLALELAFLLGVLFFLQGIAVMHGLTRIQGLNPFWLVGLYVLMVIALPQMFLMLAALGAVDSIANFRERFAPRQKPPGE
jgi:hypothetical protein